MIIEKIEIRKIFLPYLEPFTTSGWTEDGNYAIIVKVFSEGIIGWGESPESNGPWYNEETNDTGWSIQKDFLVPMVLGKDIQHPDQTEKIFSSVKGNNIAKSGIEFAIWDLYGKKTGKSLSQLLGGKKKKVEVGVSIGIQKDNETLIKKIEGYLSEGYRRIKIKIKPGYDIEPVRSIRKKWKDFPLQVDANSAYTFDKAKKLKKLDDYNLLLIEQPLAHDDIYEHSKLQELIKTPICLDESITSLRHANTAIDLKACGIINIKPSRVGGLTPAKEIHDLSESSGIPVWCGGMLETGIGRAINVALASLSNFTLPGDISANSRYFKRDIVRNPFSLNEDGTLTVPDKPGSGAEVDEEFLDSITLEKTEFKNK
ncbi:MAG TPA: o-succinylbenzoate synthase [Ignavibacteriaceae bacterium]|nr:o-succinylbenzoate synthase [Ignavibacteriaceae bacterium]